MVVKMFVPVADNNALSDFTANSPFRPDRGGTVRPARTGTPEFYGHTPAPVQHRLVRLAAKPGSPAQKAGGLVAA
jgi:hypothetical protein